MTLLDVMTVHCDVEKISTLYRGVHLFIISVMKIRSLLVCLLRCVKDSFEPGKKEIQQNLEMF